MKTAADEAAVRKGCRFSERHGEHVIDFFRQLRQTIGSWAGQPLELMPWQRDELIMPLFGWQDATGRRRFRVAYVEIPKKNGKSTLCSGIALYLLAGDGEPGSQVYCAASDRNQAGIVYREASAMAKACPLLRDYIIPSDSVKNLALPSQNAFLRVISADAYTAEGLNVHGLIFDELHAQRTRDLWDALRYGGASRRQPLLVSITTAGWDKHSFCYEQHARAEQVLDGRIEDPTFFAMIKAAGPEDDWRDPKTWRKANPSMGVTINEMDFAQEAAEAQESPTKENAFKRYRLDVWTEQEHRWLQMDKWNACASPVAESDLVGRECFAGLDLAQNRDINAFVLLFPLEEGRFAVLPYFFAPEEGAYTRERTDGVPYLTWARQGLIELMPGNCTDHNQIRKKINLVAARFRIREIAFDPWGAQQLANDLQEDGFTVFSFQQSMKNLSEPTKGLETLILSKKISHGGHPILTWMAGNVTVDMDAPGNIRPNKAKSSEKIDGIVALIMAIGRATLAEPAFKSVYTKDRGLNRL